MSLAPLTNLSTILKPTHTQTIGKGKFSKFTFYFPLLWISVTFRWSKKFELTFKVNSTHPLCLRFCFDFDILLYLKLVCHSIWSCLYIFSPRRLAISKVWWRNFPKEVIKQIKITFKMFSVHTIVAGTVSQPDSETKMFPPRTRCIFPAPQLQLYYENFILIVLKPWKIVVSLLACPRFVFLWLAFALPFSLLCTFFSFGASVCIMHYV